ncbi:DNA-binding transcriptional regulator, XRE-family HTH domain [Sphaerochaeta associata]|uniref:Helix-turn-helix domain-containing protein n=1 Tax=Sphaerochaeta associata TaxID=1129264 RepID=A0ABY4D9N7_9SPIR|nr:helix-turn-helix transcriptional regulator [Sphaerochaeta associata]MDD3057452.1 helix-turn-helix transcriptional regulator [Sphaerochaeta sp.]NCB66380.1 XRE family transcriptional regulator [Bacilli bacterium]UOM50158.1 helix-turn-helix domain-containing protein [Sphaerochaeta associata]SMP44204.1 DNA-binding transcriptional regulator, XRE-family HTH domain [Sphaerochaeta associata]
MQFHEKLKACRISLGLTQEQLAERVYVSRVTVSKWETGRGLPNLGSLQQLAALFSLSVDELLSTNELVFLARSEVEQAAGRSRILLFGILDFLAVLLLFLPLFANGDGGSVALFSFSPTASFLQPLLITMVGLLSLFGVFELAVQSHLGPQWCIRVRTLSFVLGLVLLLVLVSSRQPYPATFLLCLVFSKVFMLIKRQ